MSSVEDILKECPRRSTCKTKKIFRGKRRFLWPSMILAIFTWLFLWPDLPYCISAGAELFLVRHSRLAGHPRHLILRLFVVTEENILEYLLKITHLISLFITEPRFSIIFCQLPAWKYYFQTPQVHSHQVHDVAATLNQRQCVAHETNWRCGPTGRCAAPRVKKRGVVKDKLFPSHISRRGAARLAV